MPNFSQLPEKLILNPVQPVPLPKNYHFSVGFVPGWLPPSKDKIQLFFGEMVQGLPLNYQDQINGTGFSRLLADLLEHVSWHQLWGKQLPCVAVALAADSSFVARSNTLTLAPVARPTSPTHYRDLAFGAGDNPVPAALMAPMGRRLYYRTEAMGGAPASMGRGWYIDAANRLVEGDANRGFDRFSFWTSAFAVPPKHSANVQTGEMLAMRLNAGLSRFVPKSATMRAIGAAVNAHKDSSTLPALMWTATRVVVVHVLGQVNLTAFEFDAGGLRKQFWDDWLPQQDPNAEWSFRLLDHVPMPIWGVAGLQ